jgi:hypothetical protein
MPAITWSVVTLPTAAFMTCVPARELENWSIALADERLAFHAA